MHGAIAVDELKINALEGRAEDYGDSVSLPARWNVPHVERRLIEAKKTLLAEPVQVGPAEYGCAWPDYEDEWATEIALARLVVEGIADKSEKAQARVAVQSIGGGLIDLLRMARYDAEEAAGALPPPTLAEMTRMERALGWPGRYLGYTVAWKAQLLVAVQHVTFAKALGRDADWVATKIGGVSGDVWQRRCWGGCERIVWGLERDRVVVF